MARTADKTVAAKGLCRGRPFCYAPLTLRLNKQLLSTFLIIYSWISNAAKSFLVPFLGKQKRNKE
jgi:hypothetical protein